MYSALSNVSRHVLRGSSLALVGMALISACNMASTVSTNATKDRGVQVDVTSELYDGTPIRSAADLRAALVTRGDVVISHLAEMLMSYALGRRVEYYDMPEIRRIVREAKADGYRMSSLILGVARSAAFRTAVVEGSQQRR